MPLIGRGRVQDLDTEAITGTSLRINVEQRTYFFSIRRIDGQTDDAFAPFHQNLVTEQDIKRFLPNWQNLHWSHDPGGLDEPDGIPLSGPFIGTEADDPPYQIILVYKSYGVLHPSQITAQFAADLT